MLVDTMALFKLKSFDFKLEPLSSSSPLSDYKCRVRCAHTKIIFLPFHCRNGAYNASFEDTFV